MEGLDLPCEDCRDTNKFIYDPLDRCATDGSLGSFYRVGRALNDVVESKEDKTIRESMKGLCGACTEEGHSLYDQDSFKLEYNVWETAKNALENLEEDQDYNLVKQREDFIKIWANQHIISRRLAEEVGIKLRQLGRRFP